MRDVQQGHRHSGTKADSPWGSPIFVPFAGRFLRPESRFYTAPAPATRTQAALAAAARLAGLPYTRHAALEREMRRRLDAGRAPWPVGGWTPWARDPARVVYLSQPQLAALSDLRAPRFHLVRYCFFCFFFCQCCLALACARRCKTMRSSCLTHA